MTIEVDDYDGGIGNGSIVADANGTDMTIASS